MVNLLELYCAVDDFMKGFMPAYNKYLLTVGNKQRDRKSRLSASEIITVLIFFTTLTIEILRPIKRSMSLFSYVKNYLI